MPSINDVTKIKITDKSQREKRATHEQPNLRRKTMHIGAMR